KAKPGPFWSASKCGIRHASVMKQISDIDERFVSGAIGRDLPHRGLHWLEQSEIGKGNHNPTAHVATDLIGPSGYDPPVAFCFNEQSHNVGIRHHQPPRAY